MGVYYHGKPVIGQRGPAGPDGNPIGTVISVMGKSVPDGYLPCDGSIYNIEDYPDLANYLEKEFGEKNYFDGDGETTFAVPDMNGRFLLNAKADKYYVGNRAGLETTNLTTDQIPSHTHVVTGMGGSKATIATNTSDYLGSSINFLAGVNGSKAVCTVQSTGGSQSHNNMPPYIVVTFCIKAIAPEGDSMPSGSIIIWSGLASEIPEGWALCDGENGTPDLRSKFVWGYNPERDKAWPVGETGGVETVTLTIANLPPHDHDIRFQPYSGGTTATSTNRTLFTVNSSGSATNSVFFSTASGTYKYATQTKILTNTGSGTAHTNLPPFMTLCYIMKL